jgi:hypothetical protein
MRAAVGTEIVVVELIVVVVVAVVVVNIGLGFRLIKLGFFKIRFAR